MESIAERMLRSKGIYNLKEISGLNSNRQIFGYVDAGYKAFHVCDNDLNVLDLRGVFGKRYVVLMQTDDTYVVDNRLTQTADGQNVNYFGLLDTDNGTIDSDTEYQALNNGRIILPYYYEERDLNESFFSRRPLPICSYEKKDAVIIVNDKVSNSDGVLVLGKYVLSSFPFVLYDTDGTVIRSFPEDYYLQYLVNFKGGGFVFWFFSDSDELQNEYLIYVGKNDDLSKIVINDQQLPRCRLDDIDEPLSHFDDNAVLLACDNDSRAYRHSYCVLDNNGGILTGSVYYLIRGYKNGVIIQREDNYLSLTVTHYDSADKRISGSSLSGDQYAVFTRRTDDPFSLNGTKELQGVVKLEDMSVIVPFIYDNIEIDEREYFDKGKRVHYVTSVVSTVVEKGKTIYGLYKNGDMLIPLSEDIIEISPIRLKTYVEDYEDPINVFSGYYACYRASSGFEILFCDSERTYEVDSYSVLALDASYDEPSCVLLVEKDSAFAIMKDGKLISDYKYSCVEKANIRRFDPELHIYYHDWLIVYGVGKNSSLKGLFNLFKGEVIPPLFNSIEIRGDVFVADEYLFSMEGKLLFDPKTIDAEGDIKFSFDENLDVAILCGNNLYDLHGKRIIDADSLGLSFVCHYDDVNCFTDAEGDYVFIDYCGERLLQGDDYIIDDKGTYVFSDSVNEGLVFIPSENRFHKEQQVHQDDECHQYDYYQEQYDYEEDTYYALGGDDYQRFKENGGSIDDMMEGMGL